MKSYGLSAIVLSLALVGCGGSDDSSSPGDGTPSPGDGTPSAKIDFNIKGGTLLIANEDVVQQVNSKTRSDKSGLFTYQVVSDPKVRSSIAGEGTQTNFLVSDEEGNTSLALESKFPVKVMYSATNPVTGLVYLALDTGWSSGYDTNDYSRIIVQNNCAIYEVNATDNSYICAQEGVILKNTDDHYYQTISGNQKPIQFDEAGNVYFLANEFSREGSGNEICFEWDNDTGTCKLEGLDYWMHYATWSPRLYKYSSETNKADPLTQDNEGINFFLALSSGEIVYQSYNTSGNYANQLSMLKDGNKISLTGDHWGVDFFTADTSNAVLFGQNYWSGNGENGIRVAKPNERAALVTSINTGLFSSLEGDQYQSPNPNRVIVGDDGNLYGVFTGSKWIPESNKHINVVSVYQVLPYNPVPRAVLELPEGQDWWYWMGDTPFQIANGFLYYTETIAHVPAPGGGTLGSADYVQMINLNTLEKTTLLKPQSEQDARYEIYTWRLSGHELVFSALDKNGNKVKTGVIDTIEVRDGAPIDEFLTLKDSASATGSVTKVKDIEIIKPQQPEKDTGGAPSLVANGVHMSSENRYSVSVEFSKYMDKKTVTENLNLTSDDLGEHNAADGEGVGYMPIWIYKKLHLIPDLDGFANETVQPLTHGNTYSLDFTDGIRDAYGRDLVPTDSHTVTMPPLHGWYVSDSDSTDDKISDESVAKFAGIENTTTYYPEDYTLASLSGNQTQDIRIEFSAKNFGGHLGTIKLVEPMHTPFLEVEFRQGYIYTWANAGNWISEYVYDNKIANGEWASYRIDAYGSNLVVSIFDSETAQWSDIAQYETLGDRSPDYDVVFGVTEGVSLDNLLISTLDANGNLTTEGDIGDEDFGTLENPNDLPNGTNNSGLNLQEKRVITH